MDQEPLSIERVKQRYCTKHKYQLLDQIDLTGNSQYGRICQVCIQTNSISVEQYQSINQLFKIEEGEVLSAYPPLKSQYLRNQISFYCSQNVSKSNIDKFFNKLREDIETEVQAAQKRAKQELIKNEYLSQNLSKQIHKIGETDKLKQLLISEDHENLKLFLKEKWNNAEQSKQEIQEYLREVQEIYSVLQLDQKYDEVNFFIKSLQQLNLFDPPISKNAININFLPSHFNRSYDYLQIEKSNDKVKIISNSLNSYRQCYLEQVLDENKCYVISLKIKSTYEGVPQYQFGLINEDDKDTKDMAGTNIYYQEDSSRGTINKVIKGWYVHSNYNQIKIGKKTLEFRFHLKEKVVKVSSPPNYLCVAELNDKTLIDLSKNYLFAIKINNPKDSVTIQNVVEVSSFNSDM